MEAIIGRMVKRGGEGASHEATRGRVPVAKGMNDLVWWRESVRLNPVRAVRRLRRT